MRLCITSKMDFYLDCDFRTNNETARYDLQGADHFDQVVYEIFVNRLNKAFPAGSFSIRSFDVSDAYEANAKAA